MRKVFAPWNVPGLVEDVLSGAYLDICPAGLRQAGSETLFRHGVPLRPSYGDPGVSALDIDIENLPFNDTVYLTLGTVFHDAPALFRTCLSGLAELPVNIVVSSGPGSDPKRLGPQPSHVVIRDYIPQARLLPHCRLVIQHGGAGTLFGGAAHGLPQLVIPQAADNFLNAAALRASGAGLALLPHEVTADSIRIAAGQLLRDPEFTVAAKRLQAEIHAMPTPESTVTTLLNGRTPGVRA
nr:nucleotide disphospho-sugar-binding domain-containing protein [Nocardia bovistercoris]